MRTPGISFVRAFARRLRRRPSRQLIVRTAAIVVLLELAALVAWWIHDGWRRGQVVLDSNATPLRVQVLDESGTTTIGEPVDVVGKRTLSLPAGDYRLRVDGDGLLGRTYRMAVVRGETATHGLNLDEGRLLGEEPLEPDGYAKPDPPRPIPFEKNTSAVELRPGRLSLVEWSAQSLLVRDGPNGHVMWDMLKIPAAGPFDFERHERLRRLVQHIGANGSLVRPAADLDGDGTRDLVWTFSLEPALLAVSGRNGAVLWTHRAELDGPGSAYPDVAVMPDPARPETRPGEFLSPPVAVDVDHDGVPDLLGTVSFGEFSTGSQARARMPGAPPRRAPRVDLRRRVVLAVSGRTGKRIWSHAIDREFATVSKGKPGAPAELVAGRNGSTVALVEGSTWSGLDPATGRLVAGPIDLGLEPVRPVQYADLDGDGQPELLAVGRTKAPGPETLSAFRIGQDRPLWTTSIDADAAPGFGELRRTWPWPVDLDGDGRAELVVPHRAATGTARDELGLGVLDGLTGRLRWSHPLQRDTGMQGGPMHVLPAPDLDGDGILDLVATSYYGGRPGSPRSPDEPMAWIYLDAISGKDGRPLWWWRAERSWPGSVGLAPPFWWGRGPDGWPLLAVPLTSDPAPGAKPRSGTVPMLAASTGQPVHSLKGWDHLRADDLDGDGILDLWGRFRDDLRAYRGQPAESWRALGWHEAARPASETRRDELVPAADLDGDGVSDVLGFLVRESSPTWTPPTGKGAVLARSGRDGRLLWRARLDARAGWFDRERSSTFELACHPLPDGDLDGDGVPDVIVQENRVIDPAASIRLSPTFPLMALSGRNGRTLWTGGPLPPGVADGRLTSVNWHETRVIEPGALPDLFVRRLTSGPSMVLLGSGPVTPLELRLARISGRTGRAVWDVTLRDVPWAVGRQSPGADDSSPPLLVDLDGDGSLDRASIGEPPYTGPGMSGNFVSVTSTRDGRVLWPRSGPLGSRDLGVELIESLDLDGERHRALVVKYNHRYGGSARAEAFVLQALDGRDGRVLWQWPQRREAMVSRQGSVLQSIRGPGSSRSRLVVAWQPENGRPQAVVLDDHGREVRRLELPGTEGGDPGSAARFRVLDLDGDGVEEFLTWSGNQLQAIDQGGKELWSRADTLNWITRFIPAAAGRPATLVLSTGLALDGKTGRALWSEPSGAAMSRRSPVLLDPGGAAGVPRVLEHWGGVTIVRPVVATTPDGRIAPSPGSTVPPGLARDDPRWLRPLPWVNPIRRAMDVAVVIEVLALAAVNVVLPLGVLWLFARGRRWSIRLLMLLPVAVAVPLWVFQTVEPMLPAQVANRPIAPRVLFTLATLAGLPPILVVGSILINLAGRRWRVLAWRAGVTAVAAAIIAAVWIRDDLRLMSASEHYDPSGWPLVLILGAMAAGALIPFGWLLRKVVRWPRLPEAAR